jgi:peptide/nickel transport system permease protein
VASTPASEAQLGPPPSGAALAGGRARARQVAEHWLARRLAGALLTLFGVAVLVFAVLRLIPGDQITASLGTASGLLSPEGRHALESYYGLDESVPKQFVSWLGQVLTGNLGVSIRSGESVGTMTLRALPVTLELALLATIIGSLGGLLLGMLGASRPRGARDAGAQFVGLVGLAVPSFVVGTAVVTILASKFHYFPNGQDYATPLEDPGLNFQQMIFPALVLALEFCAPVMRTSRSALLEVASRDFVRTARGKGVSSRRVMVRHILHNALIPIVTIVGIQFGYLLGGAVIVEQIFALPGLGRQVVTGISQRDYAVVQSTVLVIAACFVVVNVLVDVLYSRLDPRVKLR